MAINSVYFVIVLLHWAGGEKVGTFLYVLYTLLFPVILIFGLALLVLKFPRVEEEVGFLSRFTQVREDESKKEGAARLLIYGLGVFVTAVVTLFIFYLVFKYVNDALRFFFLFITITSMCSFLGSLRLKSKLERFGDKGLSAYYLGVLILGLVLGSLWIFFPSWLIYNLTVLVVAFNILTTIEIRRMRWFCVLLIAILFYDLWAVFLSGQL